MKAKIRGKMKRQQDKKQYVRSKLSDCLGGLGGGGWGGGLRERGSKTNFFRFCGRPDAACHKICPVFLFYLSITY
jgi:hypothetical protein